jgi:hypothetical protein
MKRELSLILLALYWLALIGFIGPGLISARSSELVLIGLLLILVSAYATYRLARNALAQSKLGAPTNSSTEPRKEDNP